MSRELFEHLRAKARSHIAEIRRDKFKISEEGFLLDENPLATDLREATERLSEGLYSEDIHFIFELLQNAEDNSYETGIEPALTFHLTNVDPTSSLESDGALIIKNNEAGLTREHVTALCSVGKTTKTKQEGYIGEKGIGFKSVFQATACPHLYSRGYSFCFPEEDNVTGLGYIVPYWLEHVPDIVGKDGTTIILPLRRGKRERIEQELGQIAPETILFLKKIKSLSLMIDSHYQTKIVKDNRNFPLVDITSETLGVNDSKSSTPPLRRYWLETVSYSKPDHITAAKREKITERPVTVALPLSHPKQLAGKVFAYLPTRLNTGVPFLVNADFLLPTSREAIKVDEAWNHWLRDCIAPTFVAAFEKLVRHPEYGREAYRYIPLTKEVTEEFFKPVAESACNDLSAREVVLLEHGADPVKPEGAATAKKAFREVFDQNGGADPLRERPLVRSDIEVYEHQLKAIGVRPFSVEEMLRCLKDRTWLSAQPLEWFVKLYRYLMNQKLDAKALQSCPIVPGEGKPLTSDAEQPIYFQLSEDEKVFLASVPEKIRAPIEVIVKDLYNLLAEDNEVMSWLTDTRYCHEVFATAGRSCLAWSRCITRKKRVRQLVSLGKAPISSALARNSRKKRSR